MLLETASAIMLLVGAARYVEKCHALRRSNLANMKDDDGDDNDDSSKEENRELLLPAAEASSSSSSSNNMLNNEEALLLWLRTCYMSVVVP